MVEGSYRFADVTLGAFTEALASDAPVPGGGSASAVAGSLAASLLQMVGRLSLDRPRYAMHASTHVRAIHAGEEARFRLLELADEDATAYAEFTAARKMPRETAEEQERRTLAIGSAARRATEVPLEIVRQCHLLVREVEALAGRSNLNAASDLGVSALLAQASARGAGENVLINLPSVDDSRFAGAVIAELEGHLHDIESAAARVQSVVRSGSLRKPEPA